MVVVILCIANELSAEWSSRDINDCWLSFGANAVVHVNTTIGHLGLPPSSGPV